MIHGSALRCAARARWGIASRDWHAPGMATGPPMMSQGGMQDEA